LRRACDPQPHSWCNGRSAGPFDTSPYYEFSSFVYPGNRPKSARQNIKAWAGKRQLFFAIFQAEAEHVARTWSRAEFDEKAILCGACGTELSIRQYLDECQACCPLCGSRFNPRCNSHYPLYFETEQANRIKFL
jgi:uncharacterized CHY-type Zn-finger protein